MSVIAEEPSPLDTGPVAESQRLDALDVLRGFALLGILVMNIQSFSMPDAAYMNPTAYGDLTGINFIVWLGSHVFTDQKMMAIFSMLFGAGIVLMTERREAEDRGAAGLHYRRMFWLLVFGAVHAYLIWHGDILFTYAVCGMVLYPLRKLQPRTLIVLGVLVLSVASLFWAASGWAGEAIPEAREEMTRDLYASEAGTETQIEAFRGSWSEQMAYRGPIAVAMQTWYLLMWGLWRASGMMLLGMALFKVGVLTGRAARKTYLAMIAAALLVGVPLILVGVKRSFDYEWDPFYTFFFTSHYNYWGSVLVALGWVAVVMLICRAGILPGARARLAAVGRMAFTNYLMQSILCTLIFYGHGLGLFGSVERWGQLLIVFAVWAAQLAWSPWWLARFRFGPAEWLWRTLSYGHVQPMRRRVHSSLDAQT